MLFGLFVFGLLVRTKEQRQKHKRDLKFLSYTYIVDRIKNCVNSNFRVHCGWPDCGGTRMAFLTRFGFVYHISINLQPSMNYKLLQHIEQHKESEKI